MRRFSAACRRRSSNPGNDMWYAEVSVIGFKKGWFLIEGGEAGDEVDDKTGEPAAKFAPYAGRGWVSANLLIAQLGSPLKAAPSADAAEVVKLDGSANYQDIKTRRIFSCSGPWLHVEIPLPAGAKLLVKTDAPPGAARGWVDGTCEQQRTTCDYGGWQWSPPPPRRCRRSRGAVGGPFSPCGAEGNACRIPGGGSHRGRRRRPS